MKEAMKRSESDSPFAWNIRQTLKRIMKIAIPYYFTWFVCFWGIRLTQSIMGKDIGRKKIILDFANSIYELLFLEMFGFKKGVYSNDLSWFFSALLIVTFLIGPFASRYKNGFSLYFAPIILCFLYGILSLNFDYLWQPYQLIGNTFIMKGTVRALAAICIGAFIHGIVSSALFNKIIVSLSYSTKIIILSSQFFLWTIIIIFMIYPFKSRSVHTSTQLDYIIIIMMSIALIPLLGDLYSINDYKLISNVSNLLGKLSFFAFFGQPIFFSFDQLIYILDISVIYKAVIENISVIVISIILAFVTKKLTYILKYKIDIY